MIRMFWVTSDLKDFATPVVKAESLLFKKKMTEGNQLF